jgi:hypothetical protein
MVQTKTKTMYTRQRPKKTASFLVMLRSCGRVLYTAVCIEKQLQCAADGVFSSSAQAT